MPKPLLGRQAQSSPFPRQLTLEDVPGVSGSSLSLTAAARRQFARDWLDAYVSKPATAHPVELPLVREA